jgi:hypothetical protein
MRVFTCEPGTEVAGATVSSLVKNLTYAEYAPLVSKYHFDEVDPDEWYPLEDFLAFLTELMASPNQMFNLVAIALSIIEVAHMPPELENATLPQMVEGWDSHYQANFRNGYVGFKTTTRIGSQHYKIVLDGIVLPDDFEYGVLYGFARRYLPPGTQFTVWYDEKVKRRDHGGDVTVLHVKWD